MVGLVDNDTLCEEIAAARAVVMFSREETAPTIIAQAMAAGKPVVASRVGGIPEMVSDGVSGFLVEPEDEDALAERMQRLLEDQDLCLGMGLRGHDLALERFAPMRWQHRRSRHTEQPSVERSSSFPDNLD